MNEGKTANEAGLEREDFTDELSDEALDRSEGRLCPGTMSACQ